MNTPLAEGSPGFQLQSHKSMDRPIEVTLRDALNWTHLQFVQQRLKKRARGVDGPSD